MNILHRLMGLGLLAAVVTSGAIALAQEYTPPVEGPRLSYPNEYDREDGLPTVRILQEGRQLEFTINGQSRSIDASSLNVQVMNALNCQQMRLVPRQNLRGQRFFSNSVAIDPRTGNFAVGVILQECVETQVSAMFVIHPRRNDYSIYRVQVPGDRTLPNASSTYPLNGISSAGYLDGDLLVKHGDASGSQALLVFTPAGTPAGQYAGCVYTSVEEGTRLCPPTSVAN